MNTWLVLGAWPFSLSSPYRVLLTAKVGMVAVLIGIALFNRYVLVPRLRSRRCNVLRSIARNTVAEIGFGTLVLTIASMLGTVDPM